MYSGSNIVPSFSMADLSFANRSCSLDLRQYISTIAVTSVEYDGDLCGLKIKNNQLVCGC